MSLSEYLIFIFIMYIFTFILWFELSDHIDQEVVMSEAMLRYVKSNIKLHGTT